ncbi:MAG: HAMP domain-containing protein [Chloroflexi bacterium]|nr:HAMP domain-containing protein [Chloroflexota bacterium]
MRRRLSIRSRLTLWHIGLLALTLIAFSAALYVALSEQLYRSLDQRLELASLTALGTVRREGESDDDNSTFRYTPSDDMSARLLSPDGQILQALGLLSNAPVDPAILDRARAADGLLYTIDHGNVPRARAYVRPRLHDGRVEAYIEVAEPLTVTESALSGLALIVLIAVPITLAAAGFGGWFIADRALRPIDTITRQAQRISEQDLHRRLELDLPDDEVGRLARTFDTMLARLDAAFQRQRQFTADASHELRTPLTVMKTNLGVTLNRPRSAEQYETALTQIDGEVDRLTRLTNDLLLLARSDAGQVIGQPRPIDLLTLVTDVIVELRPLAEAKALTLTCATEATATVQGDADQLHRVFFNLIENAIKYTSEGAITARIQPQPPTAPQPDRVRVTIEDAGPGIAAEHLPHVFERFYRVDAARSREQGGSGLGLAIAHSIITAHHGTLGVSSELGHGATFTITLPTV